MSILSKTAWKTSRLIAHNGGAVSRVLYKLADIYKKSYNNLDYDMESNGEYRLLDRLSTLPIKTILDVGANKGDYTQACLSRFKDATIHSFEIAPLTYQKLINNVSSDRVKLNNFGLSNSDGSLMLNYNPDHDGVSSILDANDIHDSGWKQVGVVVKRGDEYCRSQGVDAIDLLKVDVEGAEHLVFEGFSQLFDSASISAVQFEFGMVNIYSKYLMKDFYDFFTKYGFALGPVMPNGVAFKEYNVRDEDFQGPPNFFAVHKSKAAIMDAVRR